jgi:hypothetical protein
MKPCAENQKLIVWLSLDALDARSAQVLREHLAACEGCRRYLREISSVTTKLAAAEANPGLPASDSFHHRLAGKLRSAKPASFGEILAAYLTRLNWRVALPAIAAIIVIGLTVATWRPSPEIPSAPQPATETASVSSTAHDLAPTLANYQRVANQSLAKLDALLTQQGSRALPSMPVYTASSFTLANGAF